MESAARSLGMGCVFTELGGDDRSVCVPPIFGHSGLPVESTEGRSVDFVDLPTLAGSAVVSGSLGTGMRRADHLSPIARSVRFSIRRDSPSTWKLSDKTFDGKAFRSQWATYCWLICNTRHSSYESAWRNWVDWCLQRNKHPLLISLKYVLEF